MLKSKKVLKEKTPPPVPEPDEEEEQDEGEGLLPIEFKRIRDDEVCPVPERSYPGDAGMDLTCARQVVVMPGARVQVAHNIAVAIPEGFFGLILPRSSALLKKGILVSLGIIDNGFRGELQTVVHNPTPRAVYIEEGDRLSQLIVLPIIGVEFQHARKDLPPGDRGERGFGSTGGMGAV
jgi:dUTP pyrophosphatase